MTTKAKKRKNGRKEEATAKDAKGKKADGKASKTRSRSDRNKNRSRSDKNKNRHADGYCKRYEELQCTKHKTHRTSRRALFMAIKQIIPDLDDHTRRLVMCTVIKEHYGLSFRQLATHFAEYAMDRRMCGIKPATNPDRPYPSKSTLQAWAAELAELNEASGGLLLADIVTAMAGDKACGSLHGDSSGFAMDQYRDWEDAKRGIIPRRLFVKLHIVATLKNLIVGFCATPGTRHDSPIFRHIFRRIPDGTGDGDVMLDAAYDARENCNMIRDSGRRPVINTRSNAVPRGFGARAKMIRWRNEEPDEFKKAYGKRNNSESVFSSIKRTLSGWVRGKTLATQTVELFGKVICHNMSFYR